ncbi:MAG: hypothetical protein LUF92_17715 [Clostridiales bacterium]|nr:hypothetical protein [Clostridiales bacterium]
MLNKVLSTLIIITGAVFLSYPWISNWLFEHRTNSIVNSYQENMDKTDDTMQEEMLLRA